MADTNVEHDFECSECKILEEDNKRFRARIKELTDLCDKIYIENKELRKIIRNVPIEYLNKAD